MDNKAETESQKKALQQLDLRKDSVPTRIELHDINLPALVQIKIYCDFNLMGPKKGKK